MRRVNGGHMGRLTPDDAAAMAAMAALKAFEADVASGGDGRIVVLGTYEAIEPAPAPKPRRWWTFWKPRARPERAERSE